MNIHELLERKNLNQYSLSKISGVPLSTVKKIISGKHKIENCSGKTIRLLSNALECSMEQLMEMNFDQPRPSVKSFSNKNEYYKKVIGNRKNVVLAKESASDYLHLSNVNLDPNVYVYSCNDLPEPFVVSKIENFEKLDYKKIDGVLVTSENQTINDLLEDKSSDPQTITETIANYYFSNNESFDGLSIDKVNEQRFQYYADEASKYYDED